MNSPNTLMILGSPRLESEWHPEYEDDGAQYIILVAKALKKKTRLNADKTPHRVSIII